MREGIEKKKKKKKKKETRGETLLQKAIQKGVGARERIRFPVIFRAPKGRHH